MNSWYSWRVKLVGGGVVALVLLVCSFGAWGPQAEAKSAATKSRDLAMGVFFQVEVEGRWSGTFRTCSGLGSESELVETKVADKGMERIMKVPGRLRVHDVKLTRALTADRKVWEWRQEVVVGKIQGARQKCTITMMSADGRPVAVWELTNAWPVNLVEGTEEDADTPTEQVTITCEGVTRRQ